MHHGFTYGLRELLGAGYKLETEQLSLFETTDGIAMFTAALPMLFDPWGTYFEVEGLNDLITSDGVRLETLHWPVLLYYSDAAAEFLAEYECGFLDGDWPELIGTAAWSDNMEMHSEEGDHYEPWELWPLQDPEPDRYWEARGDFDDCWCDDMTEYIMLAYQCSEDDNYYQNLATTSPTQLTGSQLKSLEDMELMRKHAQGLRERLWDPATRQLRVSSEDLDFEQFCTDTQLQDAWFLTQRSKEINLPVYRQLHTGSRKVA